MSTQFNIKTIRPQREIDNFKPGKRRTTGANIFKKFFWLVLLVVILYFLFVYVLPSVKVTVFLNAEEYTKEYQIVFENRSEPLLNDNQIFFPAELEILEGIKKDTFVATGEKNIGDKANGTATFYNFTGRTSPLTTKIELIHPSGKKYFLQQNTTIPQATVSETGDIVPGVVTAQIEAEQAGEDYNQADPGRINISVFTNEIQNKIYAEVENITGGSSEIVQVVSTEDVDSAINDLSSLLLPELKDKLANQIQKTKLTFSDDLTELEIVSQEKSIELDNQAEEFELKLTAQLKALVFDQNILEDYLKNMVMVDLPPNKMIVGNETKNLLFEIEDFDLKSQRAIAKLTATYYLIPQTDLDSFKVLIKGKNQSEARRELMQMDNVRDVRFDFSLSIDGKIPNNENKIDIRAGN